VDHIGDQGKTGWKNFLFSPDKKRKGQDATPYKGMKEEGGMFGIP
jgi:hypothetical protein